MSDRQISDNCWEPETVVTVYLNAVQVQDRACLSLNRSSAFFNLKA